MVNINAFAHKVGMRTIKTITSIALLALVLVCCQTDPGLIKADQLIGTYKGIFIRDSDTASVEIKITEMSLTGSSDRTTFPAICTATYIIEGNNITFENTCFWTANFDWSLILDGLWQYQLINEHLTFTHKNGDRYILDKVP
jgi:hypothetical protein